MLIELYIFAFVIVAYGIFTTIALIGFGRLEYSVKEVSITDAFVSIVMSARNEEATIRECFEQIIKQKFFKTTFRSYIDR